MDWKAAKNFAPGQPGIEPRWARSDKDGVGTAYSSSSPVWFTTSAGIVNEVYFPTIDSPQIRDLQFMVADGKDFFCDERRGTQTQIKRFCQDSLGYQIRNTEHEGRFTIHKTIITAPHAPCLLIHTRWDVAEQWKHRLRLYTLLAPHLGIGGWGNHGWSTTINGLHILMGESQGFWLAMACSHNFDKTSCGYVGRSDGWTDLSKHYGMNWEYDAAVDGNIALTGRHPADTTEFTLALAFGEQQHAAVAVLLESLAIPFEDHLQRFGEQWQRACKHRDDQLGNHSFDGGQLFRTSHNVLLAHEDKTYHGAMIASLSIPWGESKTDDDLGGYHLVWTRDMVNSATGLLASGETETPFRALVYLACSQRADGGFYQNFWIDGRPYWQGIQLDEVAFPIMLAWRLFQADALKDFAPYPMVRAAAIYLVQQGPVTPQERWEENSGYSPSTLAAHIAGLICASEFAKHNAEPQLAEYFAQYADYLESHIDRWTVTTQGTLDPRIPRHLIRLLPVDINDPFANDDPNTAQLRIKNHPSDSPSLFPAREIVDAGFLELVRYGIRKATDKLILDSLELVDQQLKVTTPVGPCWRRYNHDGYGQRSDGGPYTGVGTGRIWPLLTGERAHYELAAGKNVDRYIQALEGFAGPVGMLPEQVWDAVDLPAAKMYFGQPTGSAMPLMWAHAEYLKLLRSVKDGKIFDRLPEVAGRYSEGNQNSNLELWKTTYPIPTVAAGTRLRIQTTRPFRLRWTEDQWNLSHDENATSPSVGIYFCDIDVKQNLQFTFWWSDTQTWEGKNYNVLVQ